MKVETRKISWTEVDECAELLSVKVQSNNVKPFDLVVGISRGGIIPARLVAEYLEVKNIEVISPEDSYMELALKFAGYNHILIVDDINDSGKTFTYLEDKLIAVNVDCILSSLYIRYNTRYKESEYGYLLTHDRWLVFPWEHLPNGYEIQKSNSGTSV